MGNDGIQFFYEILGFPAIIPLIEIKEALM